MDFPSEKPRPRSSNRSTFAPLLQRAAAIPTQWCLAPLWPWRAITVLFACEEGSHQPTQEQAGSATLGLRRVVIPHQAVLPAARPNGRGGDLRCGAGPWDAPRYPRHPIGALCSRVLKKCLRMVRGWAGSNASDHHIWCMCWKNLCTVLGCAHPGSLLVLLRAVANATISCSNIFTGGVGEAIDREIYRCPPSVSAY